MRTKPQSSFLPFPNTVKHSSLHRSHLFGSKYPSMSLMLHNRPPLIHAPYGLGVRGNELKETALYAPAAMCGTPQHYNRILLPLRHRLGRKNNLCGGTTTTNPTIPFLACLRQPHTFGSGQSLDVGKDTLLSMAMKLLSAMQPLIHFQVHRKKNLCRQ